MSGRLNKSSAKRVVRSLLSWAKALWLKNPIRAYRIAAQQHAYMDTCPSAESNLRVVIFIVPGYDGVGGGVMSIFSLAEETERLREKHGAQVFVCPLPGHPPLLRYTKFPNNRILVDLHMILSRYDKDADVLVHIPEVYVGNFLQRVVPILTSSGRQWRLNIMLQNVDFIPSREEVERLMKVGPVTVTTAHEAYSGVETEKRLGCPVHHFSVWISPAHYERKPFADRKNIFVLSPDQHEKRGAIVRELKKLMPTFQFVTIKRMAYTDYKNLISSAKFSLTFGEGLDGYYAEMIFAGGIGCAVYNDRFFTEDFADVPFVYSSWDMLLSRLPEDSRLANVPGEFERISEIPYRLLCNHYSYEEYKKNISSFYDKYFSMSNKE